MHDTKSLQINEKYTGDLNTAPQNTVGEQKKSPMRAFSRAKALEAAAATLEKEAEALRREAKQLRQREADRHRRRELETIWRRVAEWVDRGVAEETARGMVANASNVPLETVDYWMNRAIRQSAACKKWRRDRQLFQIAHTRSNRELAEIFGLHEKTVSRILQGQLKMRYRA
ncbi:MAG: hypothetical protein ACK4KX_03210 [Parvibaculum sp.]|uniref:hypothetical protein n=1 Tax=Parvibaculum sp. TaxID=2024848 RepID=UPI00391AEC10